MHPRCLPLALLGFLLAFPVSTAGADDPAVLVVADILTPDGLVLQPSPGQPIYYLFIGGIERNIGAPVGGTPSSEPSQLRAELVRALATRGYVETKIGGPMPQIALVYIWGNANLQTDTIVDADTDTGETTSTGFAYHPRDMIRLIGLNKARNHLLSSTEAQDLSEAIQTDRVYIFLAALDAPALRRQEKKVLWRTTMSIDSYRHSLPEMIHVMVKSGAPYFATEMARPVLVSDEQRNTSVTLGELQVLGVAPDTAPKPPPPKSK